MSYVDVAAKAREMGMGNTELAREMSADGYEVVPVSKRKYRVEASDFEAWKAAREKRFREDEKQRRRRAQFVKGEKTEVPDKPEKVVFRR